MLENNKNEKSLFFILKIISRNSFLWFLQRKSIFEIKNDNIFFNVREKMNVIKIWPLHKLFNFSSFA